MNKQKFLITKWTDDKDVYEIHYDITAEMGPSIKCEYLVRKSDIKSATLSGGVLIISIGNGERFFAGDIKELYTNIKDYMRDGNAK
jgi:hypothetical protein